MNEIYKQIVKQRDKSLKRTNRVGDYNFLVARAMIECLIILDGVNEKVEDTIK